MSLQSHPIDIHVGHRLRALRLEKGLTQEDLGVAVGVSYQQIQKYETGFNRISASRLYVIARQLGVGPEYFFDEIDEKAVFAHLPQAGGGAGEDRARRA